MKKSLARVKQQLADQLRPGKENFLGEELQAADKRAEFLRETLQTLSKALPLPVNGDKRKKGPDSHIYSLLKNEKILNNELEGFGELIQPVFSKYTDMFYHLSEEYSSHELEVDKSVTAPLHKLIDTDISKLKKNLNKYACDRDSANSRLLSAQNRQSEVSNKHHIVDPSKLSSLQEDVEEAGQKVEQASDQLAHDMFTLLTKEPEIANYMLLHIKLRRQYYENALDVLNRLIPDIENLINNSGVRPVFNCPLADHLRVTKRKIAFPIELCVCAIMEHGICEEGLFRVAGGASKLRRLKLSIDSNCLTFPLPPEYKDIHLFSGVLKSYLRELPEPLLTFSLHDEWIHCGRITNEEKRLHAIKDVLSNLPTENYDNLQYLIKFLSELSKNSQNRMSSHNIAIVMSPNLLWGRQEPDLDEIGYTSRAVDTMVTHADLLFPEETKFFETYKCGDIFGTGGIISHVRNNSNDTGMIILDNEYESSSPKPVMRRKNKPAPEPPKIGDNSELTKLDKPSRIITSGTVTVNRSTYKNHDPPPEPTEMVRRKSLDMDRIIRKEHFSKDDIGEPTLISNTATTPVKDLNDANPSVASQTCKITRSTNRPPPVAAPRLSLATDKMAKSLSDEETVELRNTKPIIPERPPSLRPASFRLNRLNENADTMLERTVMYQVPDKQFVQFKERPGHDTQIQEKEKFLNCNTDEGEEMPRLKPIRPPKPADILTKSTERLNLLVKSNERLNCFGVVPESGVKSSHSRTMSDGNIVEKTKTGESQTVAMNYRPPSPRGPSRPPRPQPPPPPPPTAAVKRVSTESTDL